ncbi:MAG TPA: universal stress protein [Chloroflexota bacterium]|nr:universal stress protein [Chloroflexota bacterium]
MAVRELEPITRPRSELPWDDDERTPVGYRRLLVPLDGSTRAAGALEIAVELAEGSGAAILLVHAVAPATVPGVDPRTALEIAKTDATAMLERGAQRGRARGLHVDELLVTPVDGEPRDAARAILTAIRHTHDVDLVVMTTHGRTGLRRAVFGSVADRVVRSSDVPVLLVPDAARCHGADPPCGSPDAGPACVLVALDGSETAASAVLPAAQLATATGAGVELLRVVPNHGSGEGPSHSTAVTRPHVEDDLSRWADALLDAAPHLPFVRTAVLAANERRVPAAIIAHAARNGAYAIALATHGRGGFTRLVLGSVTSGVVAAAETPVLVVPPVGRR